ncbi:MAG: glycosyltransferase family 2 protein [Anaerolineae bacterium]
MQPFVSIIVPCYNEQATIRHLLEAIHAQTYPLQQMEVIIADGLSTDDTRKVIWAFQQEHPDLALRVVDNVVKTIPAGLNRALQVARGEIIVRLDAHSMPYADYIARCVAALQEGRGENVGGVWEIRPGAQTSVAAAIAAAAAHPLGVGDALYRLHARPGAVDTVPFGAFRRSLIEKIGAFDETLLTNEDYEFNARVRLSGGKVWLEPNIRSVYFARPTLEQLARQYWRYGFWKWRMLRRYPQTLRWRQALPPLFVLSLCGGLFLGLWFPWARLAFLLEVIFYFAVLLLASLPVALRQRKLFFLIGIPLAIATMHLAWGSGFLWSMLSSWFGKSRDG